MLIEKNTQHRELVYKLLFRTISIVLQLEGGTPQGQDKVKNRSALDIVVFGSLVISKLSNCDGIILLHKFKSASATNQIINQDSKKPKHPMRITVIFLISLHLPLFVISSRSIRPPDPQCTRPDPNTLRSDQMTVVINGFSEHRIPLLRSITAAYAASPSVAAVVLLWCNPSTPPRTLSDLTQNLSAAVLRAPSASLNHRFHPWAIIRTRAVLICDDDIEPDPNSVSFAFKVWGSDPDRAVGFFARSHAYDVASRAWIYAMETEKYSIVLTKFMIVSVAYLEIYSCDARYAAAREIVDEMNNCEDILMNFVVAEESRKGPVMVGARGGGVRDHGDARNDGAAAGVREVGLSSRRVEHRKRRGECITRFHRVLGRMPLKYSYGKMVDDVGEQGLCDKSGKLVLCDHQDFRCTCVLAK